MEIACAALLLDADGTLVDSTAAVERTWRVWAAEYGVEAEAVLRVCHGRRSEETIAQFVRAEEVERAVARLDELELMDLDGIAPCPGADELLAELHGVHRTPWAVVTSCTVPLVTTRMRAAGLPLPEVLVTAEDVAAGKPDPEGYRLAAQRLGVPAGRSVVVEDAPAGVRAGRAAGAAVAAVTTTHPAEELAEADVVVASMREIGVQPGVLTVRSLPDRTLGLAVEADGATWAAGAGSSENDRGQSGLVQLVRSSHPAATTSASAARITSDP